jgi:GNAT superfamily N-acetyltransferase
MNSDIVIRPDLPAVPGLSFRRFRGPIDFPLMIEVLNRSTNADHIEQSNTLEEIKHVYTHLINCDPYQDMLMVEIHGKLIGYNRIYWFRKESGIHTYLHLGFLIPEWRGKGIGHAMIHAAETRLREIAATHPPESPKWLAANATQHQTGLHEILQTEGYTPVRYFFDMIRPLNEPFPTAPLPAGLEIRPAHAHQYRQIWDAHVEAFREHWGFGEPREEHYQDWISSPTFNPDLWQIAWDGDQVAGMILNFINEKENHQYQRARGYTENIGVRKPWRKRGLARALLVRSMQIHKNYGMTETALEVDAENATGALQLYESVGYKTVNCMTAYEKPL